MIDLNAAEIVFLGVLAVIIFGPEKLPELARKAARVLSYLRNIANDATGRLRQELGPEFADLDLADLNPRALVSKHLLNPMQSEVEAIRSAAGSTAAGASAPESQPALPAAAPAAAYQADPSASGEHAVGVAFDTEAT